MLNKFLFFLLFIPVIVFTQVEDEACLPPGKKVLKKLEEAKSQTDVLAVVTAYQKAIEINPDNATPYYEFALYAYNQGLKNFEKYPNPQAGNNSFVKAEKLFKQTLDHCSDFKADCFYYLGVIDYSQSQMDDAINWFKKFKDYKHTDLERFPSDFDKKVKDIDEVVKDYEEEQAFFANKVPYDPIMVPNVSSPKAPEYFPMISPDNELMFFTRKVEADTLNKAYTVYEEQFTFATRPNIANPFDEGQPFTAPFNTGEFQSYGAATMSVDNKEMIICACKNEIQRNGQPYLNCDLYITEYQRSGEGGNDFTWKPLENMGTGINTSKGWEGQPTLSADGNTLYFTAMRPTTRDNDIYVVHRNKDGKWGDAMPFDVVNTEGKDKSPFLHQDSETLYFVSSSSDERRGAGGLDIFYIRKENGVWSKPKNIGVPINSEEDELGIFVSTNGELAYFSSRKGGDWNIYAFELYEEARPSAVTIMKGSLKDENGNPIKDASIEVAYENGEKSTIKVNGDDGNYAVVVKNPTKQDVMLTVKKEGYAFDSKLITKEEFQQQAKTAPKDNSLGTNTNQLAVNSKSLSIKPSTKTNSLNNLSKINDEIDKKDLQLNEVSNEKSKGGVTSKITPKVSSNIRKRPDALASNTPVSMPKVNLEVKELKVGVPYTINDILFETNSSELSNRSKFILRQFSDFLKEHPSSKILIQGHTDDVGDPERNMTLSQERAESVKGYLVELGISPNRLKAKGYGVTIPKVPNNSEANRAKNRRTDFLIESLN